MKIQTLLIMINLRGNREQAFKFAFGYKGGMKGCYTKGCEIFTPLMYNIKGSEITEALAYDRVHEGEWPAKTVLNW